MSNFRKRSKTIGSSPNRLKPAHTPKTRTPLTFRKFADFLLRRKSKRKAEQDPDSLVLDKQIWYHGKITAEYAGRCLRRQGDFLVREDPAKPGSCFLVVRGENKTALHLPINKVKSSKGNRIKYQIEDATESFDSISELINHHVQLKTPLTRNTGAVIANVVSRDTTLLADEVFAHGASNEPFYRHNTDANAFATIRRTPQGGRTRERRSSDPTSSTRTLDALNIDSGPLSSGQGATGTISHVTIQPLTDEAPPDKNDSSERTVIDPEDLYDKPENNSLVENVYDKPAGQHLAEGYYDKPDTLELDETYDKPDNSMLLEDLYDKPCNNKESVPSVDHSDSSSLSEPHSPIRSNLPVIDSRTTDSELERCREDKCPDGQQHSGFTGQKTADDARKDRNKIYLGVIQKIQALLVEPFLRYETIDLARHMTRIELEILWRQDLDRKAWTLDDGSGGAEGLEILTLPQGRSRRSHLIDRYTNVSHWVAALVVGAGDLGRRELVLSKLIELADVLSDKLGNLVSFMAVMDGLALAQVSRLHHTWSCLHHQHSSTAILYHSTLVPLASLLQSGAPSPFPGVCLPYIVPLVRFLEMSTDEVLDDWAREGVDLGLGAMLAHLDSGRTLTQQLHVFRQEAVSRLQGEARYRVDAQLESDFKSDFNVGNALGLAANPSELAGKVSTLLQWLSENAEIALASPTQSK